MRYPRRNSFLRFQRLDEDTCLVREYLSEEEYELPAYIAEELLRMDGSRSLTEYFSELTDVEWEGVTRFLKERELIVYGRGSRLLPGVWLIGLWHGGGRAGRCGAAAHVLHLLVRLLWFPALACGGLRVLRGAVSMRGSFAGLIAGLVLGLALGITCHELSHAASAAHYGALLYEMGVGILLLMPVGYVIYDTQMVRSRRKQIHILLAGVRMNFLLAGLSVILMGVFPWAGIFFYGFGRVNLVLGLLNLCVCGPLDGRKVLMRLLEFPEDWTLLDLWPLMRGTARLKGFRGVNGQMMQAAAFVLMSFHLMYGLMVGLELWGIVQLIL